MASRPRLSIVTPSLNQGAFLERALRSVLDQTYTNVEYLVVDGGSTDGSIEIIKRYQDQLAWWVSEPDRGQTDALNKGLRRATGDYVAYINSDDYYLPGAFRAAAETFERTRARWVAGSCRYEDHAGRATEVWIPELPHRDRHWWMLDPWGVPQAATFWRRDLFEEFGYFREDMHYVFDTEFGLRLVYNGVMPAIVNAELAVRVVHPEAKSWNLKPFRCEQRRFASLFADMLDRREQVALRRTRALHRIGWYRARAAAGRLKRRALKRPPPVARSIVKIDE